MTESSTHTRKIRHGIGKRMLTTKNPTILQHGRPTQPNQPGTTSTCVRFLEKVQKQIHFYSRKYSNASII
jgi:hypothetical protein